MMMKNIKLNTSANKISPTALLKKEDWGGLCEYYSAYPDKIKPTEDNAQNILLCAIGYLRKGEIESGLSLLSNRVLAAPNARDLLRRWVISPLAPSDSTIPLRVVDRLLTASVCQPDDVLLVSSRLLRDKCFSHLERLSEEALRLFPDNSKLLSLHIRSLSLAGKDSLALALARTQLRNNNKGADSVYVCLSALNKSASAEDKALALSSLRHLSPNTVESASLMIDILNSAGHFKDAIRIGEAALAAGIEGATFRRGLGLACYKANRSRESKLRAVEHLRQSLALRPENLRAATFYADLLIRTGQNAEAIPLLERWLHSHPHLAYVRALYARALRQEGQYAAASEEFTRLACEKGADSKWNRYAAAALLQAGKREEAEKLFDGYLKARSANLAATFEEGLRALDDKIDQAAIPVERLDWAWDIGGKLSGLERREWERRARWGYLADNYLLDWLECRGEQADEPMYRLADLEGVEKFFARLQLDRRGCIIVSAHIGAMYAGPMIMSLLDMNSKWVASTPGVLKGGYAERLISVSDKSEADVVRACVQTLHDGQSLVIAIDGSLSLSAPCIEFLGQQITYSTFSSRLAYKMHLPTVFGVPVWREGRIEFMLEKMVDPQQFESLPSFTERWKENYLSCVTRILQGAPENLRLSGGLWRNITKADG